MNTNFAFVINKSWLVYLLLTAQLVMSSPRLRRRNLKTEVSLWQSPAILDLWFSLGQGNHVIIVTSSFSKSSVFKMFSVQTKTKSRCIQIPPVWRTRFQKAPFSWRISVDAWAWTLEMKLRSEINPAQCGRWLMCQMNIQRLSKLDGHQNRGTQPVQ